MLADPFDMVARRDGSVTIAAHATYVLVKVGNVVKSLVASHFHGSENPFFVIFKVLCNPAYIIVDFEWRNAAFIAHSSVPLNSVY